MPKAAKPRPKPEDVYKHARCFLHADMALRDAAEKNVGLRGEIRFPGMVNSAFASELFLKCLLLLEDKTPPKDHNLLALFNLLDNGTKAKLEAEWVVAMDARKAEFDEMEKQFKIKIPRDLPTALAHCGNAFQIMRYIYENPTGANFFITDFPMALFIVIRRITGWK